MRGGIQTRTGLRSSRARQMLGLKHRTGKKVSSYSRHICHHRCGETTVARVPLSSVPGGKSLSRATLSHSDSGQGKGLGLLGQGSSFCTR